MWPSKSLTYIRVCFLLKLFTLPSGLTLQLWGTRDAVCASNRHSPDTTHALNIQHVSTPKATHICLIAAHAAVICVIPRHLKKFRLCMKVFRKVRVKTLNGLPPSTIGLVPGAQRLRQRLRSIGREVGHVHLISLRSYLQRPWGLGRVMTLNQHRLVCLFTLPMNHCLPIYLT